MKAMRISKYSSRWILFGVLGIGLQSTPALSDELSQKAAPFRLLLDQKPGTLNPRATLEAQGQRVAALLFKALTRIDSNLDARPDAALKWETRQQGKEWRFELPSQSLGEPSLTPKNWLDCLEEYRAGLPPSPVAKALKDWKSTELATDGRTLVLNFVSADPDVARNISLLRYFQVEGESTPCRIPQAGKPLRWTSSGDYRVKTGIRPGSFEPDSVLLLEPVDPKAHGALQIEFVRDENTRLLKVIRGEADGVLNALPLAKTRWVQTRLKDRYALLERPGVTISYLAFNLRDPLLARSEIRKAISLSIDREALVRHKMFGFGQVASSLVSPLLENSAQPAFEYDPKRAEALLDRAGFPRGKDGVRLRLTYKTTPVREGHETAVVFQSMLRKVGIELEIQVVESAVFAQAVRKGGYQLHSGRWVGVADTSILANTLHSQGHQNRWGYQNPEMDLLLEKARSEAQPEKRRLLWKAVQEKVRDDLPYFPLWYWSNALVLDRNWEKTSGFQAIDLSLSGALSPISRITKRKESL
jgi:ABC-type transport system substrate-binding protein